MQAGNRAFLLPPEEPSASMMQAKSDESERSSTPRSRRHHFDGRRSIENPTDWDNPTSIVEQGRFQPETDNANKSLQTSHHPAFLIFRRPRNAPAKYRTTMKPHRLTSSAKPHSLPSAAFPGTGRSSFIPQLPGPLCSRQKQTTPHWGIAQTHLYTASRQPRDGWRHSISRSDVTAEGNARSSGAMALWRRPKTDWKRNPCVLGRRGDGTDAHFAR